MLPVLVFPTLFKASAHSEAGPEKSLTYRKDVFLARAPRVKAARIFGNFWPSQTWSAGASPSAAQAL